MASSPPTAPHPPPATPTPCGCPSRVAGQPGTVLTRRNIPCAGITRLPVNTASLLFVLVEIDVDRWSTSRPGDGPAVPELLRGHPAQLRSPRPRRREAPSRPLRRPRLLTLPGAPAVTPTAPAGDTTDPPPGQHAAKKKRDERDDRWTPEPAMATGSRGDLGAAGAADGHAAAQRPAGCAAAAARGAHRRRGQPAVPGGHRPGGCPH